MMALELLVFPADLNYLFLPWSYDLGRKNIGGWNKYTQYHCRRCTPYFTQGFSHTLLFELDMAISLVLFTQTL